MPARVERPVLPRAAGTVLAGTLLLAGCAAPLGLFGAGPAAPAFRQPGQTVEAAAQSIAIGASTRAEVQAALGPAETLRFDSGHEVWVYRARGARDAAAAPELVILFSPQGVVRKLRVRPAYAAGG